MDMQIILAPESLVVAQGLNILRRLTAMTRETQLLLGFRPPPTVAYEQEPQPSGAKSSPSSTSDLADLSGADGGPLQYPQPRPPPPRDLPILQSEEDVAILATGDDGWSMTTHGVKFSHRIADLEFCENMFFGCGAE